MSYLPPIQEPNDRSLLLKDAARLPRPLDDFVVYDRDGYLGMRFISTSGGPTEAGVEIEMHDFSLGDQQPDALYFRLFKTGIPHTPMRSREYFRRTSACGRKLPTWSQGSQEGFMADLAAIVRANASRFGAEIGKGRIMVWVNTANETFAPRLSLDPSELHLVLEGAKVGPGFRGWLLEDLGRLSPGLFRRNLPTGCSSTLEMEKGHWHEPVRFSVAVDLDLDFTSHQIMGSLARYEEIVAATLG